MAPQLARLLELEQVGDVVVMHVASRRLLDETTLEGLDRELSRVLRAYEPPRLLLNFAGVEHLSSAVVGTLLRLTRRVQAAKGRLALCQLDPVLAEVFEITGASQVLNIYGGEQEALHSF